MKRISDKIWSIEMFSDKWWKQLHETCKGITPQSSNDSLASWFSEFVRIWCEDNWYDIDIWNPDKTKTGESFYCYENQCKVFFKWNLEYVLLTRWSEYLLWD